MWSLYSCYEWFNKIKSVKINIYDTPYKNTMHNTTNIINNTHYYCYMYTYDNEYDCHFIHKCGKKADRIICMRSNMPPKNRNVCEECYQRLINEDKIKKN
jgi:hypothetical protein